MNTVSFQNKGLIDPIAIKTFGVSAKDCDDPIGFFGTGLKYAIAILLRNKCEITIMRGLEEITFSTITQTVREQDFEVVCMNGEPMGFTLELGKTWEMWQAFRELYCNTLDEHGDTFGNAVFPQEDWTTIIVKGAAFYDEYTRRDKILLTGKPDYCELLVEVHNRAHGAIHYQGVRVGAFERPPIMTYNIIGHLKLTEDRTVDSMSAVNERIRIAVLKSTNKEFIKKFVTAPKDSYEATVDLNWFESPGETFMEVMEEIPFQKIENGSLLTYFNKHRESRKVPQPVTSLTDIEKSQLEKAIAFSSLLDFPVDKFTIHVTDDLSDTTLGMAYAGEIYVARRTFMMDTKMVAATLIEEYIHIEKGFNDCTYPMQNFLFEKLVSLGEQLIGETL